MKDMADQLRPVANAIDGGQADNSSLASACEAWLSLLNHPNIQSPVHKAIIVKRFKQAILPEHLTAYKLHPEYQGAKLSAVQTDAVNDFLVSKNPAFITELMTFEAKSAPYPKAFFTETALCMDPIPWWKAMKPSGVNPDFVVQLLHSPASFEHIFSNFGHIHSKVRNRLSNDTASKLVFFYCLLRGDVEIDY